MEKESKIPKSTCQHANEDAKQPNAYRLVPGYKKSSRSGPFNWKPRPLPSSDPKKKKKKNAQGYLINPGTLDILTNMSSKSPPTANAVESLSRVEKSSSNPLLTPTAPSENVFSSPVSSRLPSRAVRNLAGESCVFCNESLDILISSTDVSEALIELKCGHISHEECFKIGIDFEFLGDDTIFEDQEASDTLLMLPSCKCGSKAVPIDTQITDHILSEKLLKNSTTPSTNFKQSARFPNKSGGMSSQAHQRKPSRGSSKSAMSSIISSALHSPSTSFSFPIRSEERSKGVSLALDRSKIISMLLDHCSIKSQKLKEINENMVDSLGLLRLLDRLYVSFEASKKQSLHFCYLFSYLLLVVDLVEESYNLLFLTGDPALLAPQNAAKVDKLSPSLLRFRPDDHHEVFVSSDNHDRMEKWSSALMCTESLPLETDITDSINLDQSLELNEAKETPRETSKAEVDTRRTFSQILSSDDFVAPQTPPKAIIMVINQIGSNPASMNITKNAIKAILLIKIDLLIVFTASKSLSMDTLTSCYFEIKHSDDVTRLETFWERLDSKLSLNNAQKTLSRLSESYLNNFTNSDVSTVILSNYVLDNIQPLTESKLLLEVGVLHRQALANKFVTNVSSWDEIMEKMCTEIGLDFDMIYWSDTDSYDVSSSNHDDSQTTEAESITDMITDMISEIQTS